jgi:hypothetical protein
MISRIHFCHIRCSLKKRAGPKPKCKTKELVGQQQQPQQQQQQQQQQRSQLQQQQRSQLQQQQQQQHFKLPSISTLLRETRHSLGTAQSHMTNLSFTELSRKRYTAAAIDQYGSSIAAAAARPNKRAHTSAPVSLPYGHSRAFIAISRANSSSSSSRDPYNGSSALQSAVPATAQQHLAASEVAHHSSIDPEAVDIACSALLICSIKRSSSSDEDFRSRGSSSSSSDSPQYQWAGLATRF